MANMECWDCGEPIGYDRRFLKVREDELAHEECLSANLEGGTRRDSRAHDSRFESRVERVRGDLPTPTEPGEQRAQ